MEALRAAELRAGDKLPPEADVARFFGVSRMTLRQALAGLASRGLLERIPGRSGGTFIIEPTIDCDLTGLTGFTEQLRRADIKARARVVAARTVPAGRQVARRTRGRAARHPSTKSSGSGWPRGCRWPSSIPGSRPRYFPDLLSQRLTGSLYRLLTRHYGQRPHTAVEYLEPATVTDEEAEQLERGTGRCRHADRADRPYRRRPAGGVRQRPVPAGPDPHLGAQHLDRRTAGLA